MNIGIQRELTKGGVLTVDYLRNIGLHFQIGVDVNHAGDSRYLELNAANNAIANTLAECGVGTNDQAIAACPDSIQRAVAPASTISPTTAWIQAAPTTEDIPPPTMDLLPTPVQPLEA